MAGFALPWLAFITWPTKKPNSLSLPAFVLCDLVGVGGQHAVDDRARSRRCRSPAAGPLLDDDAGRLARPPPSPRTPPWPACRRACRRPSGRAARRGARRGTGGSGDAAPGRLSAAKRSPVTQFDRELGVAALRPTVSKIGRGLLLGVSTRGVVGREAEVADVARASARPAVPAGGLGSCVDPGLLEHQRQQVGVGEVAVVVRVLLGAHASA